MEGKEIKELLLYNDNDLNNFQYYKNDKIYNVEKINNILVSKEKLKKRLMKKFGKNEGNYIIKMVYCNEEDMVDPKRILDFFNK